MIRRRFLTAGVLAVGMVLLDACGGDDRSGPPDINYGRDVCAECHMIISEARFAAAFRDRGGEAFAFDDIGDMVAYAQRAGIVGEVTAWVHDYDTERWITAPSATYVRGSTVLSPMGHNTVAFAERADARAFLDRNGGELATWSDLTSTTPDTGSVSSDPHH